jgi:hypothetical protein
VVAYGRVSCLGHRLGYPTWDLRFDGVSEFWGANASVAMCHATVKTCGGVRQGHMSKVPYRLLN